MYGTCVDVHQVIALGMCLNHGKLSPSTPPDKSVAPVSPLQVVMYGTSVDVHQVIEDDPIIAKLHKHARVYDSKVGFPCCDTISVLAATVRRS